MKKADMAKCLVCYREGQTQKWVMTKGSNESAILYDLLKNQNVDKHSIFVIPVVSIMCGGIWLCSETHKDSRFHFNDFFNEYEQKTIHTSTAANEYAKRREEEKESNSKYGWISPDGRFYRCEFEGHANLADKICFGMADTINPELYLEEHGWCKIYNPIIGDNKYAVYLGKDYVLTKEQFNTIKRLGLEDARNVSAMLVKD